MVNESELKAHLKNSADLEYILLGDLKEILCEECSPTNHYWMTTILESLVNVLPKKYGSGREGGYLDDVLELAPHSYHLVEEIRQEQQQIHESLADFYHRLQQESYNERLAKELQSRVDEWIAGFQSCHEKEHHLIAEAYYSDLGGGD